MAEKLRTGFTTGTCATAAAKTAAIMLTGNTAPKEVSITLPGGDDIKLPVAFTKVGENSFTAGVVKNAGDDPDVTDGVTVIAELSWLGSGEIVFSAGDGVGIVTKKGLSVAPGEAAINPVPREMIRSAIRSVTKKPLKVTISIPGGRELAEKTFNPRLGIIDGLSVLGTSGIVRPYSCPALRTALECSLDVALGNGVHAPIFTAGNIGTNAAINIFRVNAEQVIEVSNEWGFMLDKAVKKGFRKLLALGHPGKLAKLAANEWDTHSSRSGSALPVVYGVAKELFDKVLPESPTVEGIFEGLQYDEKMLLGNELSKRIKVSIQKRTRDFFETAVALVNMKGELIGSDGKMEEWQK